MVAFRCFYPRCFEEFSTITQLEDHRRRVHPPITLDKCPVCQEPFACEDDICTHYRAVHNPMVEPEMPSIITCPNVGCTDLFNNRNDFYHHWTSRNHSLYHLTPGSNKNQFYCPFDFCRAHFKNEALIRLHHLLVHTVDQTFVPTAGPSDLKKRPDHFLTPKLQKRQIVSASGSSASEKRPSIAGNSDSQASASHASGQWSSSTGKAAFQNPVTHASNYQPVTLTGNNAFQSGTFRFEHQRNPTTGHQIQNQNQPFLAGHQNNPIEVDDDTMSLEKRDGATLESAVGNMQLGPAGQYVPTDLPSEEYGLGIFQIALQSKGVTHIITPHEVLKLWTFLLEEEQRQSVMSTLLYVRIEDDPVQTMHTIRSTFLIRIIEEWVNFKLLARKLSALVFNWHTNSVEGTLWTVLAYCFELEDLREHKINAKPSIAPNVPCRLWYPRTGREVTQHSGIHTILEALAERVRCRNALPVWFQVTNTMIPVHVMAYVHELQQVAAYLCPNPQDISHRGFWNSFSGRSSW